MTLLTWQHITPRSNTRLNKGRSIIPAFFLHKFCKPSVSEHIELSQQRYNTYLKLWGGSNLEWNKPPCVLPDSQIILCVF